MVERVVKEHTKKFKKVTPDQVPEIVAAYEAGRETLDEIGARYGISGSGVLYLAKTRGAVRRGFKCETRRHARKRGEDHHSWRGGRKLSRGYVYVMAAGHPCAQKSGYILEHRLVLERHLARTSPLHPALTPDGHLRRDWDVHHRDENKANNKVSNLIPAPSALHSRVHILKRKKSRELMAMIFALEADVDALKAQLATLPSCQCRSPCSK